MAPTNPVWDEAYEALAGAKTEQPLSSRENISDLLTRAGAGDARAAETLLPEVYDSLRALARRQMARESPGHTLEPTALVNEAFLRLVGDADPGWNGRRHFYGAAAQAMRRILVERARRHGRQKHGGGRERVPFDEAELGTPHGSTDLLDLDDALCALEERDARAADIVMLRYFAGLSSEDTARALEISERTVRREWSVARLWLYERMTAKGDGDGR